MGMNEHNVYVCVFVALGTAVVLASDNRGRQIVGDLSCIVTLSEQFIMHWLAATSDIIVYNVFYYTYNSVPIYYSRSY
jgi:hypothetical protein